MESSWFKDLVGKLSIPFTWNRNNSHNFKEHKEIASRNKQKMTIKDIEGGVGNTTHNSNFNIYQISGANDTMVAQIQDLMRTTSSDKPPVVDDSPTEQSFLTLSPFMGVIKSQELPGTRIHLEFTFHNQSEAPVAIKAVYVTLGDGIVHFKKFFKINENGSRADDFTTRLPIVVARKGIARLAIEFENLEINLIHEGTVSGALNVLANDRMVVSKDFVFEVNSAMISTLASLQSESAKQGGPTFFDAMIRS
ncbi:MAG: hypothetical protein WEA04_02835 [Candidatus Andersenbacteria bacterium]